MSLRSFQRAVSAAGRAGWDDASRALLREAVARGRLSAGALERLARAPHWIARVLVRVLKLGDLDAARVGSDPIRAMRAGVIAPSGHVTPAPEAPHEHCPFCDGEPEDGEPEDGEGGSDDDDGPDDGNGAGAGW